MSLTRFITAQADTYQTALSELRAGAKRSHWMWFIFPQLIGLGRSETARIYGVVDLGEARDYLADPVLGPRLIECTEALLDWAGKRDIETVLGNIDAMKFASSMTLFEAAGGPDLLGGALDAFCDGKRDEATLALLAGH